jgi:hypothetical protein
MSYNPDSVALLPVGEKVNPSHPEGTYIEDGQVGYVFAKDPSDLSKGVKYATSAGSLGTKFAIGREHLLAHDQTGRSWGWHTVVAIVFHVDLASSVGSIPDRKVPHSVFK